MDLFKPISSGFWFNFLFFWRALVGEMLKIIVTNQSFKKHVNEDTHKKPRPVICEGVSLIKGPSETFT